MAEALRHDCPHCFTKRVAMDVVFREFDSRPDTFGRKYSTTHLYLRCPFCHRGCFAIMRGHDDENYLDPRNEDFFSPKLRKLPVPEHLPAEIEHHFQEGLDALPAATAAAAMFRKCLELTIKDKCPDARGDLYKKIDHAKGAGVLTDSLADWAHHIRLQGNQAVHDAAPFSKEDAKSLREFTEMVLQYVYTFPERVRIKTEKAQQASKDEKGAREAGEAGGHTQTP